MCVFFSHLLVLCGLSSFRSAPSSRFDVPGERDEDDTYLASLSRVRPRAVLNTWLRPLRLCVLFSQRETCHVVAVSRVHAPLDCTFENRLFSLTNAIPQFSSFHFPIIFFYFALDFSCFFVLSSSFARDLNVFCFLFYLQSFRCLFDFLSLILRSSRRGLHRWKLKALHVLTHAFTTLSLVFFSLIAN